MNRSFLLRPFVLALSTACALSGSAQAQNASSEVRTAVAPEELAVTPFTPKVFPVGELFETAVALYGNSITVLAAPNESVGAFSGLKTVPHFVMLGDLLLIRDTPDFTSKIVGTLTMLETEEAKRRKAEKNAQDTQTAEEEKAMNAAEREELLATETWEVRPRYVEFETLAQALKPFERTVDLVKTGGTTWRMSNLNALREGNLILVNETPRRMSDLKDLVSRIDRPLPQMMITVTLLTVADSPEEVESLPKELEQNLKVLFPAPGFETISIGALRCAMQTGKQCELRTDLDDGSWSLSFFPQGYNPETSEFSVTHCNFTRTTLPRANAHAGRPSTTQSFTTSLTFRAGEYVVLGGVGEVPTLVVLRAQSVTQAQ